MVSKRLAREEGHKRKFLAVLDNSPECERAVSYAAMRAANSGGSLIMVYVIVPDGFEHWLGVEKIMRAEATAEAKAAIEKYSEMVREKTNMDAEAVIREGSVRAEIEGLIEEDRDIAILVLAASDASEGPGPLVSSIAGRGAAFPIPVVVVPSSLTDEDIEGLV